MARETCPAMLMITSSPEPDSASSVTSVWRLSCHRPFTPAFWRTLIHAVAPLPDERQLHPVEVLRLVGEQHRRVSGRDGNIAERNLDQIGEIEQPILPL